MTTIHFPDRDSPIAIVQDAECVDVTFHSSTTESKHTERILFHDYPKVYSHAGLYENIFHKHLQCQSPLELVSLLAECAGSHPAFALEKPLHVLDVGAGNGIVGAEVRAQLVGRVIRLVGTDILPEAHEAAIRDRPNVYDQYLVADLLDQRQVELLGKKDFDVMITCAALGPGWNDMPIKALLGALAVVQEGGLVAITVNVCWLGRADETPWGQFIAMLDGKGVNAWGDLKEVQRKRYKHRLDVRGKWIWYMAIIFEKSKTHNGAYNHHGPRMVGH
ncbi:hypothetical protein MMC22_007820 [Lobaria immixta]|nr:hypothetical protein [Lobaria immixta]